MGLGGLILLAQFFREQTPERIYLGGTPGVMEVRVLEDPTATMVRCQPGVPVGDVCYFVHTPTPYPPCPRPVDSGPCIYDGPKSLVMPTPTPRATLAATPSYTGPKAGGTGTIATQPIFS